MRRFLIYLAANITALCSYYKHCLFVSAFSISGFSHFAKSVLKVFVHKNAVMLLLAIEDNMLPSVAGCCLFGYYIEA